MNKRPNPFQPSYQPPQPTPPAHPYPPLPPGPPPPPGNQQHQEWAAYWAQHQQHAAGYSPHAPQQGWQAQAGAPTQQPAYDPALYRNYGYGGQNAGAQAAWQQPRPQAPQSYPPSHPPGYPPYPHATAYPPYAGAPAQPMPAGPQQIQYGPQYPYPTAPVSLPTQPHAPPPPPPPQQHHQPPAKRPRFDSTTAPPPPPNASIPPRPALPPQPPPLHFKPGGGMVPASQLNTPTSATAANGPRIGGGSGNPPRGGGVPLGIPNRGGGQAGRGGRGGGMGAGNRPGRGGGQMHGHGSHGGGMGRGGMMGARGTYGGSGRGPAPRGPPGFRQNNAGNRFPGGAFNKSHHQSPIRHDRNRQSTSGSETSTTRASGLPGLPSSSFNFTPNNAFRGASPFSGTGKRTLTDFRIVGFGICPIVDGDTPTIATPSSDLDWTWGTIPGKDSNEDTALDIKPESPTKQSDPTTLEAAAQPPVQASPSSPATKLNRLALSSDGKISPDESVPSTPINAQATAEPTVAPADPYAGESTIPPTSPSIAINRPAAFKLSSTNSIPVAPRHQRKPNEASRSETSRIRIYFQCPAELDDKDLAITPNAGQTTPIKGRTWTVAPQLSSTNGISVGGKRKKEDDDEDDERDSGKRKREDPSAAKLSDEPAESEFEVDMQITGGDEEPSTPHLLNNPEQTLAEDFPDGDEYDMNGRHQQDGIENLESYGDADADAEGEDMHGYEEWNEEMHWNAEANSTTYDISSTVSEQDSGAPVQGAFQAPDSALIVETSDVKQDAKEEQHQEPPSPRVNNHATSTSNATTPEEPKAEPTEEATVAPESNAQATLIGPESAEEATHPLKEYEVASTLQIGPSPGIRPSLPSPNRISISYAGSARRLVIDADVIESVRIKRGEGRIEVVLLLDDSSPLPTGSSLSTIKEEDVEGPSGKVGGGSESEVTKPATDGLEKSTSTVKSEPQDEPMISSSSLPLLANPAPSSELSLARLNSRGILYSLFFFYPPFHGVVACSGSLALVSTFATIVTQIDALEELTQTYKPVSHSSYDNDHTIPPFPKYLTSGAPRPVRLRLLLYLDKEKPLSEPKWVKTGDIEDWLKTMFGPVKTGPQTYASWSGKISIVDPDPPPNVYALIDSWVQHSMVGPPKERRRFVNEHIKTHFDNVFEILLRIVRRDGNQTNTVPPGSPLASVLPANSIHASQQTHASLAVLSLYRMAAEFAGLAGIDGKTLETRIGQLIRSLPQAQVYKSLDAMFKDWSSSQKRPIGGRSSA